MARNIVDIPTGFTGFTIDVFNGSKSDSEGRVTKALFAILFSEKFNDTNVSISNAKNYWSAMTGTGEYIGLLNAQVIQSNKDSALVLFDMEEAYPSNSIVTLCQRDSTATYNIEELDYQKPFTPNTLTGAQGSTTSEYGGATDETGRVTTAVFSIPFTAHLTEIQFEIVEDNDAWAALMGDGSYINLKNPYVLFSNKTGATVVFQMENPYPSNSPALLVRRKESAKWHIEDIDEDSPFEPIQQIIFPAYVPVGESINLSSQCVIYPMNATIRNIEWSVKNGNGTGAIVSGSILTTVETGDVVLHAKVTNGKAIGTNYDQDITVHVIDNWIVIDEHPHLDEYCVTGEITESIYVMASTEVGDLTYQWYRCTSKTNYVGATAIPNATEPRFNIPTNLIAGNYYYFCEVRKTNFPSVRTNIADIRVRDRLRSISINPSAISVPPGGNTTLAIGLNPQTCDETIQVAWESSDDAIMSIEKVDRLTCKVTCHSEGSVIIRATMEDRGNVISNQINGRAIFTAASSFSPNFSAPLETGGEYSLATYTVTPVDATFKIVRWSVVDPGTTEAYISNERLYVPKVGIVRIRGSIDNGIAPGTPLVKEFAFQVNMVHRPVTMISLTSPTVIPSVPFRVGDILSLKGKVLPENATYQSIEWSIDNAGSTGAEITSGNLLSTKNSGIVVVKATVRNGAAEGIDYSTKFSFNISSAFIAVQSIRGLPDTIDYTDAPGIELNGTVFPENANGTNITYGIAEVDKSGVFPKMVGNVLSFDPISMSHTSEVFIIVSITVENGYADGIPFMTFHSIYVTPPPSPEVYIPVESVEWALPSILRAYRPMVLGKSVITPWNADSKALGWKTERYDEVNGCAALIFVPTADNHQNLVDNGVLFNAPYKWDYEYTYVYPMSAGRLKVTLEIENGRSQDPPEDFTEEKVLTIKDPYIPVVNIENMPSEVYNNTTIYLSPELDTGKGVDEQTAIWDDREATYQEVKYTIEEGVGLATINAKGELLPTGIGTIRVVVNVASGKQEAFTWHDDSYEQIDYEKRFNIEIKAEPSSSTLLTLKLKSGSSVTVNKRSDFEKLRAIRDPDDSLSINGTTFKRSDVTEISFAGGFNITNLSNFGRNMTSLTKISAIPDGVTNLRNFLRGCTSFNQFITIPDTVTGDRCLEGFLRGCTSFNQPISIPRNVNGNRCLESFLRDCVNFDNTIITPEEITGDYAMYCFLQGCLAFNSPVSLPRNISGYRCMENTLRDCTSFNKAIQLPEKISGRYNIAAFMFNCNEFNSNITVPAVNNGSSVDFQPDVITLSTFFKTSTIYNSGVNLIGTGAVAFKDLVGDLGDVAKGQFPLRVLKA